MRCHEIRDNEWREMNEEERIAVLLTYGMSRKEAWELSVAERVWMSGWKRHGTTLSKFSTIP